MTYGANWFASISIVLFITFFLTFTNSTWNVLAPLYNNAWTLTPLFSLTYVSSAHPISCSMFRDIKFYRCSKHFCLPGTLHKFQIFEILHFKTLNQLFYNSQYFNISYFKFKKILLFLLIIIIYWWLLLEMILSSLSILFFKNVGSVVM